MPFQPKSKPIKPSLSLLKGEALSLNLDIHALIKSSLNLSPLRTVYTQTGKPLSVQISNLGELGWYTDELGYRYISQDPLTHQAWPTLPAWLIDFAEHCASKSGFLGFRPNACLINRYQVGAKMGLHQDKDEKDFSKPIVSISLGLPATFLFGGRERSTSPEKMLLEHGDVVVWGGASRLNFHGIQPIQTGSHPEWGPYRFNLTLRFVKDETSSK